VQELIVRVIHGEERKHRRVRETGIKFRRGKGLNMVKKSDKEKKKVTQEYQEKRKPPHDAEKQTNKAR